MNNEATKDDVVPSATIASGNNNGTQDENVGQCSYIAPLNEGNVSINTNDFSSSLSRHTSYANLVTGEPTRNVSPTTRKTMNFRTLITPAGNGPDVAVPLESIYECPKNIGSVVVKNVKTLRQAARDDDDLGTNGGNLKSARKGSLNVAHGSSSNTHIIEKIDKIERQILDGKLTFVNDDEKPLYKALTKDNEESESEVEVVLNETARWK
ncbi:hypothetical protein Tco_0091860 [Tanacetum coccineum]